MDMALQGFQWPAPSSVMMAGALMAEGTPPITQGSSENASSGEEQQAEVWVKEKRYSTKQSLYSLWITTKI